MEDSEWWRIRAGFVGRAGLRVEVRLRWIQTIWPNAKAEWRKHDGSLKQGHLGDFQVGNGDSASWRRNDQMDGGQAGVHSLMEKVQLCSVEAGWKRHMRQSADHTSLIQQTTSNQINFCAAHHYVPKSFIYIYIRSNLLAQPQSFSRKHSVAWDFIDARIVFPPSPLWMPIASQ